MLQGKTLQQIKIANIKLQIKKEDQRLDND